MEKISDYLKGFDGRILILTHHNADVDAVASSLALRKSLGKGDVGCPESVSKQAKKLGKNFNINPSPEGYDLLIILDTPSLEQLDPIDIGDKKIILIDHHQPSNIKEMSFLNYIDSNAKSTSEIIYKLLRRMGKEIRGEVAELVILGIAGDTGLLRFASKRNFQIVSELLKKTNKEFSQIIALAQKEIDISEKIARLKAAKRVEAFKFGEYLVAFSKVGSFEASAARGLLGLGADIAIVFTTKKKKLRISGRCKYNVTKKLHLTKDVFSGIEKLVGGSVGGHDAAASANGKNTRNIGKIKKIMVKKIGEKFKSGKKRISL